MRSWYVLALIVAIAVGLGTLLFYFGPTSLQSDVNNALATNGITNVQFTILAQGNDAASVSARTNYRITNNDEFTALWAMIYGNNGTPQIPTVDFTKYEVLAIFDGSHSSGGYGITVQSVSEQNGTRTVTIIHRAPGTNCTSPSTATSPFELVQVPATTLPLAHQDDMSTTTCP
jgi:hypothetical protein